MRIKLALAIMVISSPALAGPQCTTEPESSWLTKAEMLDRIAKASYVVDVFKKTSRNCYEIYGKDETGKRVEVYFHPIAGEVVKSSSL